MKKTVVENLCCKLLMTLIPTAIYSTLFWLQSENLGVYQLLHLHTYTDSFFEFYMSLLQLFLSSTDVYHFMTKSEEFCFTFVQVQAVKREVIFQFY